MTATAAVGLSVLLAAAGTPPTKTPPVLTLNASESDGKRELIATLATAAGPVEGEVVSFLARRSFGLLPIGDAETNKRGIARFPFPEDLPQDVQHGVLVIGRFDGNETIAPGQKEVRVPWGASAPAVPLQRTLWGSSPPVALVIVITTILIGVWSAYAFAMLQMIGIRREGRTTAPSNAKGDAG